MRERRAIVFSDQLLVAPEPVPVNLQQLRETYPDPDDFNVLQFRDDVRRDMQRQTPAPPLSAAPETRHRYEVNAARISTGLVLRGLSESIASAEDIETYEWGTTAFLDPALAREKYLGNLITPKILFRPLDLRQNHAPNSFTQSLRCALSLTQFARFVITHPGDEESARAIWIDQASKGLQVHKAGLSLYLSDKRSIDVLRIAANHTRASERQPMLTAIENIARTLRWERKELPRYSRPSAKKLLTDIEGIPLHHIPMDHITELHNILTTTEFDPKSVAALITSATRATQNLLTSLAPPESRTKNLTSILAAHLDKYDGDNPLGYSDVTALANKLTPVFHKQGLDVAQLDPTMLADFPKAIDRILFVVLEDSKQKMADQNHTEQYQLAAECIRRAAFKGVEGKLAQRVLTVNDLLIRYAREPQKARSILARKARQDQITEVEAEVRLQKIGHTRTLFVPGSGKLT